MNLYLNEALPDNGVKLQLLLVVGAKLEHIITRLAQEAAAVASLSHGTERTPYVKPSKEHFWFGRPEIVLNLIHFILFQNSFEIGFFIWVLVLSIALSHFNCKHLMIMTSQNRS